jgi:hypothetical protein
MMRRLPKSRVWRIVFSVAVGLGAGLVLGTMGPAHAPGSLSAPLQSQWVCDSVSASAVETHTIYLPLVSRCYIPRVLPFGVQFYGILTNSNGLDDIADAGAHWIRMPLSWAAVEPTDTTPEHYNWSGLDQSVINAVAEGIELVLTIGGQPSWAAVYPMGPVTDTADIKEFVGALVERYDGDGIGDAPGSPRVRYFELYNEPDNADVHHAQTGGWGYWGHNGAGYAALLRELYPVVKAASPGAQWVFGGLALDWFEEDGGVFDSHFLDDVLAACRGHSCFDVMNFHYYPPFRPKWEPYGVDIIGKANYVRQKLAEYGFEGVPVICTETSWAGGAGWGSDELQSRYVIKGYVRAIAADLSIVVWYSSDDRSDSTLSGLLDSALQPKPSYWTYWRMTRMLGEAVYQRPLTLAETGSEQIKGYTFSQACGGRLDVVWTEDGTPYDPGDDPWLLLTVHASTLRVTDKSGNEFWTSDDGDGRITVLVGGSPLYLEYNP